MVAGRALEGDVRKYQRLRRGNLDCSHFGESMAQLLCVGIVGQRTQHGYNSGVLIILSTHLISKPGEREGGEGLRGWGFQGNLRFFF